MEDSDGAFTDLGSPFPLTLKESLTAWLEIPKTLPGSLVISSWHCLNFIQLFFCPCASDKIHHLIYFYIEYLEKGRDSKTTYVQPPFYIYTYVCSECACVHLSPKKSVKNSFLFWISKLQLWGSHSNERRVPGEGTNQSGTREQPSKLRREAPLCSTAVSVPIYLVSMRSFSSPRL